jgi:type VI secretion system protein ImpL
MSLEQVEPLLNMLRGMPGGYQAAQDQGVSTIGDLGLGQGKALNAAAVSAYRQGLFRMMLPRLILRAEGALNAARGGDKRELYQALKAYLQLGGEELREPDALRQWFARQWAGADYPGDGYRPFRESLDRHLQALLEDKEGLLNFASRIKTVRGNGVPVEGSPLDYDLIDGVRRDLADWPLAERALVSLEEEAINRHGPDWQLSKQLNSARCAPSSAPAT